MSEILKWIGCGLFIAVGVSALVIESPLEVRQSVILASGIVSSPLFIIAGTLNDIKCKCCGGE